jgi:predicted nucleic acid-binding protein
MSATGVLEVLSGQNLDLVTALQRDLHRGEAETIALALELDADLG